MARFTQTQWELMFTVVSQFNFVLVHKYGTELKDEQVKIVLAKTIRYMSAYIDLHGIGIKTLDIYKIISWYAFTLAKKLHDATIIQEAVYMLNEVLYVETENTFKHTHEYLAKLYSLTLFDGDEEYDEFAIGKNGLYVAFKSPSIMFNTVQDARKSINITTISKMAGETLSKVKKSK